MRSGRRTRRMSMRPRRMSRRRSRRSPMRGMSRRRRASPMRRRSSSRTRRGESPMRRRRSRRATRTRRGASSVRRMRRRRMHGGGSSGERTAAAETWERQSNTNAKLAGAPQEGSDAKLKQECKANPGWANKAGAGKEKCDKLRNGL